MRRAILMVATMALTLLVASGVALAVTKIGTNGPDTLKGTNGDDNLIGKGGNDILFALRGRDNLLEHQSSSHAAAFRCSSGIVRAMTCRLCTTAERLRSKRFLRTPL